ncbi:MAG: tetratricopeptide repeat protein [Planctomycetia bacterium]|nr:tetratricopeptide repeat protein [Planctomycetia bacterium]
MVEFRAVNGPARHVVVFADSPGAGDGGEAFLREVRAALGRHGGVEVKSRGPWAMAVFPPGPGAVAAMVEAAAAVPLRAGVHEGDPLRVEAGGTADWVGPDVNRAARLLAAGHEGQVLVSEAARASAAGAPVGEWRDLGEHRLRGLERPERVWLALAAAHAGRRFPPLDAPSAVPTNLPPGTSAFVGRAAELEALAGKLGPGGPRLVTLTGTGGVGKSRLAVRAAAAALPGYPGGAWFADLTAASDAAGIARAVAEALGLAIPGATPPAAAVGEALALRKPMLLLLDNCEHVLAHAGATAGEWLARAPGVRVLATSRAALALAGEHVMEIAPLPTPPPGAAIAGPEDLLRWDAARLFVDRVSAARRGFEVTAENAGGIAELCARLDGLPLAVELAAARAAVLAPAEILARLDRKFDLLRSSQRDLTPRQRTLIGAIEWSFDLLGADERATFLPACVFRGGFSLAAAEEIVALPGGAEAVRAAAKGLREQSLLRESPGPAGPRFSMYVAIHEYAWQRWRWTADEAGQQALEDRHAEHFARVAEDAWRRGRRESLVGLWEALDGDADNYASAHDRCVARGQGERAARLMLVLDDRLNRRGPTDERLRRIEATLAALGDGRADLRAIVLGQLVSARVQAGVFDDATRRIPDECVALARASGDTDAMAFALVRRADMLTIASKPAEALGDLEEAETISRRTGDENALAGIMNTRGIALRGMGRLADAVTAYRDGEALYRRIGNWPGLIHSLAHLGQVLHDLGRYDEALRLCREALATALETGNLRLAANLRTLEVATLADSGRPAEALAVLASSEDLIRSVGDRRLVARMLDRRGEILTQLGDPAAAIPLLDEAIVLRRATGDVRGSAISLARRGEAHSTRGDHAAALADLEAAAAAFETARDRFSHGTALLHAAIAERRAGRPAGALKRLERAQALLDVEGGEVNRPELFAERARCAAALGRGAEAMEAARGAVEAARAMGLAGSRRMMMCEATRALAASVAGDAPAAAEARTEAAAIARTLGEDARTLPDDLRDAVYPRKE